MPKSVSAYQSNDCLFFLLRGVKKPFVFKWKFKVGLKVERLLWRTSNSNYLE